MPIYISTCDIKVYYSGRVCNQERITDAWVIETFDAFALWLGFVIKCLLSVVAWFSTFGGYIGCNAV